MLSEGRTTFTEEEAISLLEKTIDRFGVSRLSDTVQILRRFIEGGILVEIAPSSYRFLHSILQEYLAAYALAQQGEPLDTILKYINNTSWQEVLMLLGAIFERLRGHNNFELLLQSLITHPDPEGSLATFAGRLLQDVKLKRTSTDLQQAVAKKLTLLIDSNTPTRVRIEAASILGQVGDLRPFGELIEIPAGLFTMGGDLQWNDTLPEHQVYLSAFRIGRYLVTNAEFAKFIEAGGYDHVEYWSVNGWKRHQKEKWTNPNYWQNEPWNQPNYPVVGVSFFEAMAYCKWLTEEWHTQGLLSLDHVLSLPMETMWEKSARGLDARKWPWGTEFHSKNANTAECRIGSTSAVGIFPEGASPQGILDMCGNVWEWCSSVYSAYPYNAHDGREDVESTRKRVLRGGSWTSHRSQSTSVYRYSAQPEDRQNNIGFRVVEIPKLSE